MTTESRRFPVRRLAALVALAITPAFAACERHLPTSADIAAMDAAAAESHLERMGFLNPDSGAVIYYLDGAQVSAEVARAISAERIDGLGLLISPGRGVTRIEIRTGQGESGHGGTVRAETLGDLPVRMTPDGPSVLLMAVEPGTGAAAAGFDGLILLDGVRVGPASLRGLRSEEVRRVEIIKAEVATRLYADPGAAGGVIRISTHEGARRR